MVFSSLLFLFRFLPVMLLLYYIVPKRLRNGVLFIGSLIFYGWGEPVYIVLLLFSTVVDYCHGLWVQKWKERGNQRAAKLLVASSAIINLSLLGVFKYTDFLLGTVNHLAGLSIALPGLALPIGISFYTFQTMSYTIDIYRGDAKPQRNIVAFGAYVSMFPQLIAGPIVRYHTIAEELRQRTETYGEFARGVKIFAIGLGKKVLIANTVGALWTEISGVPEEGRSVLMLWMGIVAFGLQIYYDFSGYSDMAVGLGAMMGFHFPENFHYPYMAESITDFWRRWHISLSTWFKEYVYIPLGGNRKGIVRQVRNILIVWLLTGFWHGASWNFVLWGLYFGVLLLLEKFMLKPFLDRLPGWGRSVYAMAFVCFGWVLFAHEQVDQGLAYMMAMVGLGGLPLAGGRTWYLLVTNLVLLVIAVLGATSWPSHMIGTVMEKGKGTKGLWLEIGFVIMVLLLSTAYLVDASYNPFLYFRF